MKLISIITPIFNHELYLQNAIESVLVQTYKQWELILWDDGSNDNSCKIAQEYASKYPDKIYFYTHKLHKNMGQENTRNEAIKVSKGEFITLLDSDDYFNPNKLSDLISAFTNQDIGMVYGDANILNSDNNLVPMIMSSKAQGKIFNALVIDNFIAAGAVMFRKEFFNLDYKFDNKYKTCGEYPLWLAISAVTNVVHVPSIVYVWRTHDKNTGSIHEVKAKQELVEFKKNLLNENHYKKYRNSILIGLAKSEYDLASIFYSTGDFSNARLHYKEVVCNSSATKSQLLKSYIMLRMLGFGNKFNSLLSQLKKSIRLNQNRK